MFDSLVGKPMNDGTTLRTGRASVTRGQKYYPGAKRAMDLVLVVAGGLFFLPLIAILALIVRLDGGPAFYRQPRIGRNGHVFCLLKLRTMVVDADAALARHLESDPEARIEWDMAQKLRRDPRLTAVGAMLRRYSLDELPQLWNVLIGDMSLVGPRPMMPAQRRIYPGTAYYDLRPGLTGLWQISERNSCSFAARAEYDNRYALMVSLPTDIGILMRTVSVVFRGTGC